MRTFLLLAALLVLVTVVPPADAVAQECGSWREPVLCQVELQRTDEDRRWDRFDPERTFEIPPSGETEIEIRGRDQTGRSFPQYRLALNYDDRDCSGMLEIEDRGEGRLVIEARRSEGRCRLEFWVPGNMNFAWRTEIEINAGARAGYTRSEAELIASGLYMGILGRAGDAGGLAAATTQIELGNVENQIEAMLRSSEFRESIASAGPNDILERLYQGLLGRPADSTGVRTFLGAVEGRRYAEVVLGLLRSTEFEERLTRVR
jgi:hypothetical protein